MTTETTSILNPYLRNSKNNLRRLLQTAINLHEAKVTAEETVEAATQAYRLTLAAFAEAKERRDNALNSRTELQQTLERWHRHLEDKIYVANFHRDGLWRSSLKEDEVAFLEAIRTYANAIRLRNFVYDRHNEVAAELSTANQLVSEAESTLETALTKNTQAGSAVREAYQELENLRKQPPISEDALFQAQRDLVFEAGKLEVIVDEEKGSPGWKCKTPEELIFMVLRKLPSASKNALLAAAPASAEQTETAGDTQSIDFFYRQARDRFFDKETERLRRLDASQFPSHSLGPND